MLEQMGRAGRARDLVSRADAVGDHKGQRRAGVVLHQQHLQAITIEPVLGNVADSFHMREARHFGGTLRGVGVAPWRVAVINASGAK